MVNRAMTWPTINVECMFSSPTWTDISTWVQEINIKRGVSRVDSPLLRYEAGTAEIKLDNRDRRFDPTNLSGPYTLGFTSGTGEKLFTATKAQQYGHGVTLAIKSATGQTASIVNVTSVASGTIGSFTCPKPAGTANGHKVIAIFVSDVGTTTEQTLSGGASWGTKLLTRSYGDDTIQTSVWHKAAGGSEPTNYTFGQNAGADGVAIIVTIQNADNAATPVIASVDNINVQDFITPGVVPVGTNDIELRLAAGTWPDGITSWQSPTTAGYTEYVDKQSQTYTNTVLAIKQLSGVTGGGSTTLVLPNRPIRVKCTYPFTPTTNYVRNPSMEEGSTSWSGDNVETIMASTMEAGRFGGSSLRITKNGANAFNLYGANGTCQSGPTNGQTITASAYVYVPSAVFSKVTGFSITGTGIASTFVPVYPPTPDAWHRISLTKTLTANLSNVQVQFWTDGTISDGQVVAYIDAVQVEVGSTATPYCDGSLPGGTWSGTAHDSSSTRASSATFHLFRGFTDNWLVEWDADVNSVVTVPATDGFKLLTGNSRAPVTAVGAGEDTGARVTRILNSAGWSASDRLISTGDVAVQATTLEGDALAELNLVADTEIGELYIDQEGRVVFRNRRAVLSDTRAINIQARFGDGGDAKGELQYHDVAINNDADQIANQARTTRVGGAPQTVTDTNSVTSYTGGIPQTFERSDLIMTSDAEALSYAQWILYISGSPELRFESLVVRPQKDEDSLFPQVLGRQIGDRIQISRRPVGGGDPVVREVFLRGMEHSIRQWEWESRFTLQSATKVGNFLTLNHPTLGIIGQNALIP